MTSAQEIWFITNQEEPFDCGGVRDRLTLSHWTKQLPPLEPPAHLFSLTGAFLMAWYLYSHGLAPPSVAIYFPVHSDTPHDPLFEYLQPRPEDDPRHSLEESSSFQRITYRLPVQSSGFRFVFHLYGFGATWLVHWPSKVVNRLQHLIRALPQALGHPRLGLNPTCNVPSIWHGSDAADRKILEEGLVFCLALHHANQQKTATPHWNDHWPSSPNFL